ncbi:hypothetical protein BO068_005025 [Escherichia coli]|nr:hypothetical protein [Escherichia coli]EFG8200156.1 hypothetical protein [Escherichia coli]
MLSDFPAARLHLHRAYDYVLGSDRVSVVIRDALDVALKAIEAVDGEQADANVARLNDLKTYGR